MKLNQKDIRSSCSGRESVESDIIEPKDKGGGGDNSIGKILALHLRELESFI